MGDEKNIACDMLSLENNSKKERKQESGEGGRRKGGKKEERKIERRRKEKKGNLPVFQQEPLVYETTWQVNTRHWSSENKMGFGITKTQVWILVPWVCNELLR